MHYFYCLSYFHMCVVCGSSFCYSLLAWIFTQGICCTSRKFFWFAHEFSVSDNIVKLKNEQQFSHFITFVKIDQFLIAAEITRNQRIDTMTHENYAMIDASHCQEKLPKYAPIFVAVGFNYILVHEHWKYDMIYS